MILNDILGLDNTIPESEITEPQDAIELQPGEKAVGTVSLVARKLFTLLCRESEAGIEEAKELQRLTPKTILEAQEVVKKIESRRKRVDALSDLFWQEVKEELGIFQHGIEIIIRKDWTVITNSIAQPAEIIVEITRQPCNDPNCPACRPDRSIFGNVGNPFGRQ